MQQLISQLRLVEGNDAVRGISQYEIEGNIDDLTFSRTECFQSELFSFMLVVNFLAFYIDFNQRFRSEQLRKSCLVGLQRIGEIQWHDRGALLLQRHRFLRNLPSLAFHQLEEAVLYVLEPISQIAVGLIPTDLLFILVYPIPREGQRLDLNDCPLTVKVQNRRSVLVPTLRSLQDGAQLTGVGIISCVQYLLISPNAGLQGRGGFHPYLNTCIAPRFAEEIN